MLGRVLRSTFEYKYWRAYITGASLIVRLGYRITRPVISLILLIYKLVMLCRHFLVVISTIWRSYSNLRRWVTGDAWIIKSVSGMHICVLQLLLLLLLHWLKHRNTTPSAFRGLYSLAHCMMGVANRTILMAPWSDSGVISMTTAEIIISDG